MYKIKLPTDVNFIISKLKSKGYEAYIVGGCVRDSIMGRTPKDWDITTNATPQQMKEVFDSKYFNLIPTGEEYGTLTLILNHIPYEITTFRKDGEYKDGRRPKTVSFSSTLEDDLLRRDFTINAIAYDSVRGYIDPFNGLKDIKNKTIRCVGNPNDRFDEDALRIMRCLRFSCKYNFEIEQDTYKSLLERISNLDKIANERIMSELKQIIVFMSRKNYNLVEPVLFHIIPELKSLQGVKQNNPYHMYCVYNHTIESIFEVDSLVARLTMLFHDISKPLMKTTDENGIDHFIGHPKKSAEIAIKALERLKFEKALIKRIATLIEYHDYPITLTSKAIKKLIQKIEQDNIFKLFEIKKADILAQNVAYLDRLNEIKKAEEIVKQILSDNECLSIKQLKISGNDIIDTGIKPGKEIGILLDKCLEYVTEYPEKNTKEDLLNLIKEIR